MEEGEGWRAHPHHPVTGDSAQLENRNLEKGEEKGPTLRSRKVIRDAPVETAGVQKTDKMRATSKDWLPAFI